MSTLYLASDLNSLAKKLADVHDSAGGDFFVPVTVAVANPYMAKWLRLWLARKHGVVINFQFKRLEAVMWELLREVDQRQHPTPVELLNGNSYRLMILSMLLDGEAGGSEVGPLRESLQYDVKEPRRDVCRRAWQLAGRLGKHYDSRFYYLKPFVNRMPAAATKGEACEIMRRLANHLCERRGDAPVADELLCAWGKAGAESLWSMADMLDGPSRFAVERLPLAPAERSATV